MKQIERNVITIFAFQFKTLADLIKLGIQCIVSSSAFVKTDKIQSIENKISTMSESASINCTACTI